jgi:hypothetical protein
MGITYVCACQVFLAGHLSVEYFSCQRLPRNVAVSGEQGCQMFNFQTKNPNLGKFWRAFEWIMLLYFMVIWDILRLSGINYGRVV